MDQTLLQKSKKTFVISFILKIIENFINKNNTFPFKKAESDCDKRAGSIWELLESM